MISPAHENCVADFHVRDGNVVDGLTDAPVSKPRRAIDERL